jgi:actin, other eukaryote
MLQFFMQVLITELSRANVADRSKWAEMLFESFRVPSIYIANSSSLALFASGRTTGLVVECGAGVTSSVPVFEGLALAHASTSLEYGGQDISVNIRNALEDQGIQIDAGYARMLKERMAYVNIDGGNLAGAEPQLSHFSLPDGTDVSVDSSLFSECTEKLFINSDLEPAGLSAQVHESIQLCDESLMKDLSHNIVISGGTSMIAGDSIICTPL